MWHRDWSSVWLVDMWLVWLVTLVLLHYPHCYHCDRLRAEPPFQQSLSLVQKKSVIEINDFGYWTVQKSGNVLHFAPRVLHNMLTSTVTFLLLFLALPCSSLYTLPKVHIAFLLNDKIKEWVILNPYRDIKYLQSHILQRAKMVIKYLPRAKFWWVKFEIPNNYIEGKIWTQGCCSMITLSCKCCKLVIGVTGKGKLI